MRILCIATSKVPSVTANSIQVMKACQALVQLGHEVHLLAPGENPAPGQDLSALYGLQTDIDVEWLRVQPLLKRYDFAYLALSRARKLNAHLVYTWSMQVALLALMYRIPVIFELHGPPEGRIGPILFRQFLKLSGVKRLMVVSAALQNMIEDEYQVRFKPGEFVISPNGVDLERFQDLPEPAAARAILGLTQRLTAGYTGHLYPGRGMKVLVELARLFPQVQFLWVGGNPKDVESWRVKLAAENLGNILLTGFVENQRLPLYQAAADILLMPYERSIAGSGGGDSAAYCSPMKMFEYMACKRAILSSDLPVIHEVLNEKNAILRPPDDIAAWAVAFNHLLQNVGLRERLAAQAYQDVRRYTWLERADKALADFMVVDG
jgi:glycosyltransferase involved in cell wall biosynthesis